MCVPIGVDFNCKCDWRGWIPCDDPACKIQVSRGDGLPPPPRPNELAPGGLKKSHQIQQFIKWSHSNLAHVKFDICCSPECCKDAVEMAKEGEEEKMKADQRRHSRKAVKYHFEHCLPRHIRGIAMLNCMRLTQREFAPLNFEDEYANLPGLVKLDVALQNQRSYRSAVEVGMGLKDGFPDRDAWKQYLHLRKEFPLDPKLAHYNWKVKDDLSTAFTALQAQLSLDPMNSAKVGMDSAEWLRSPDVMRALYEFQRVRCPEFRFFPSPAQEQTGSTGARLDGTKALHPTRWAKPKADTAPPPRKKKRMNKPVNPAEGDLEFGDDLDPSDIALGEALLADLGRPGTFTYPGQLGAATNLNAPEPFINPALLRPSATATQPGSLTNPSLPVKKKAPPRPDCLTQKEAKEEYEGICFEVQDLVVLPSSFQSQYQAHERIAERKKLLADYSKEVSDTVMATKGNYKPPTALAQGQANEAIRIKLDDLKAREQEWFPTRKSDVSKAKLSKKPATTQAEDFAPSDGSNPVPSQPKYYRPLAPAGLREDPSTTANRASSTSGRQGPTSGYGAPTGTNLGLEPLPGPGLPPYGGAKGLRNQLGTGNLTDPHRGRSQERREARESGNSSSRGRVPGPSNDDRSGSAARSDISVYTKGSGKSNNNSSTGSNTKGRKPNRGDTDDQSRPVTDMLRNIQLK